MIIVGLRGSTTAIGTQAMVCPRCQNPAAHRLQKVAEKLTVFFLPLFTVSTRYLLDCTFCGLQHRFSKDRGAAVAAQLRAASGPGELPAGQ